MIAISHFVADHIRARYGLGKDVLRIIPRGIELTKFDPKRVPAERKVKLAHDWNLPDDQPIVLERRARAVIGTDRSSVRYASRRPADERIRTRLRELAAIRRRFGYRRLHVLLDRDGLRLNHKSFGGSIARTGCRSAGAAAANGPSARGRRWCCRRGRTSAGRSTLCRTR